MARFLITTLPSNDLGLLTRSLPIAAELSQRGHTTVFCSPGGAPRKLIADAGFENLIPTHPLYEMMDVELSLRGCAHFISSRHWRRHGGLISFLRQLIPALPWRSAPRTAEVWNMDHAGATMGMLNEGFVRANCEAFSDVIERSRADVLVDFWNPFAVIAARALGVPVVTVIQADAHPRSAGFLWWKQPPSSLPTPVPAVNSVLDSHSLAHVGKLADLSVGDLTLNLLPLPPNFRHEPYVPGLLMAEKSDLLIHHGGYGSCQTGLYAGKPAVVLPTYSERYSNARRMSDLGAAEIVHVENSTGGKRVSTVELRAAVERVLANPSYTNNAQRLGQQLRSYGGAPRAAELIETFTSGRLSAQ